MRGVSVRLLTALVVLVATLSTSAPLRAGAELASSCSFVSFRSPVNWVTTAAWDTAGQLLIFDSLRNNIMEYDLRGVGGSVNERFYRREAFFPVTFDNAGAALVIQTKRSGGPGLPDQTFLQVSTVSGSEIHRPWNVEALRPSTSSALGAEYPEARIALLLQWQAVEGQSGSNDELDIVAFADIFLGNGKTSDPDSWAFEFVRFAASGKGDFDFLEVEKGPSSRPQLEGAPGASTPGTGPFGSIRFWFRLGAPLIAGLDGDVYVLRAERKPAIYIHRPGSDRLREVQIRGHLPGMDRLPDLVVRELRGSFGEAMQALSRSSTFAGLYADEANNRLVLLSRFPVEGATDGSTVWTLTSLRRDRSGAADTLVAEGSARLNGFHPPQTKLAIGKQHWALVPGDNPEDLFEEQDISGAWMLDAGAVRRALASRGGYLYCNE